MFTRPHTPLILLALPGDDLPLRLVFDRRRVSPARARALLNGVGTALASIVHTEPTRVGCVDSGVVTARDESDPAPESAGGQAPAAQTVGGEPATETEAALCAIFADLLSLGRVGPHDNLVEFGLHSLLGTQAINRIRDEWRTAVPLQALFDPYSFSWGEVMAGGVVIALPAVILFLIFRNQLVGGLTAGGVKG